MSQSCLAIVTGVRESAVTHLNSWYMMIGPSSDAEASARAITELRNNDVSSDMSSSWWDQVRLNKKTSSMSWFYNVKVHDFSSNVQSVISPTSAYSFTNGFDNSKPTESKQPRMPAARTGSEALDRRLSLFSKGHKRKRLKRTLVTNEFNITFITSMIIFINRQIRWPEINDFTSYHETLR